MSTPDVTIVQLTDTHIPAPGQRVHGVIDTLGNLRTVLDRLVDSGQPVDAFVLSGDLTDNGSPAAYRRLRELVAPAAERLGAQVIYAMGNHDERVAFRSELLGTPACDIRADSPHDVVYDVCGVRIIVLDSTTTGRHDGRLEPEQLGWLDEQLSRPSPLGTLLVLHHPPIPSPVTTVNSLRLQQAERLESTIAGSDIRMILCGHTHHTGSGAIAGIPVWIGPAMSYRVDPVPPVGRHRGFAGFGFSRIDLMGSAVVATAVEATPAQQIYDKLEQDMLDQLAALSLQAR